MDNKRNGYFESESLKLKEYCKKKIDFLEGKNETPLTSADEMLAYTLVFNIANEKSMNYEVHLLKLYLTLLDDYLRTKVLPALNKLEGQQLLEEMWVRWEMLQKLVTTLRVIFGYLDKHYIARAKMKRLRVLGFQSFFERVFSRLHSRFVLAVLQQIEAERDKVPIKRELVSNSITLLLELEKESEKPVYREYFEDVFIQHTQEYYRRLSQIWIRQKSCSSYLKDAEDCLGFEGKIVKDYLAGNSWNRLRKCVESELLRQHQSALLNMDSGCMVMLCNNQKDDLIRLYNLYRHIEFALGPIVKIFKDHLCSEGAKVLGDPSSTARDSSNITISNADDDSGKLPLGTSSSSSVLNVGFTASVIRLLNLHDRAISFVENCFNHDKAFRDAVKETFEAYCNRSLGSIGSGTDLLACYNDDLLRQGRKSGHCDESIKIKLDKVSQLLTYLNDKDVFAELYRKLLSRRLLDQRKWNEELEKSFLRRLKDQCGTQSVSKMEGMMRDLEREREQEQKFKEWLLRSGHYQRRERRGGVGGRDDRFQKMDIEEEEREKEKEKENVTPSSSSMSSSSSYTSHANNATSSTNGLNTLRDMYEHWPFFQSTVDLVEMVMAKTDPDVSRYYERTLTDQALWGLGENLRKGQKLTHETLLYVIRKNTLLESAAGGSASPHLDEKLRLRAPYVAPLNVLQALCIRALRDYKTKGICAEYRPQNEEVLGLISRDPSEESVEIATKHPFLAATDDCLLITIKGVAAGMQNTG
mmetsp:Transcript_15103/g.26792  ORF Transcript_15103/g.26792 Transcript_15103/m.26792 type:complete len:755 (-) Transcript_15103:169-2433(-)